MLRFVYSIVIFFWKTTCTGVQILSNKENKTRYQENYFFEISEIFIDYEDNKRK